MLDPLTLSGKVLPEHAPSASDHHKQCLIGVITGQIANKMPSVDELPLLMALLLTCSRYSGVIADVLLLFCPLGLRYQ